MAAKYFCPVCDRAISANSKSLECSKCFCWVHKGCSGLSTPEFNKIVTDFKKTSKHSWFCSECKSSENNTFSTRSKQVVANMPAAGKNGSAINEEPGVASQIIKSLELGSNSGDLSDLILKNKVEASDLLSIIIHLFQVLREQNNRIDKILEEIKNLHSDNNVNAVSNISSGDKADPLYAEVSDRIQRSRNIIVRNIPESCSSVAQERIHHDKTELSNVFSKINPQCSDFKCFRLGKPGATPRPLKVMLSDVNMVSFCLKNKRKLLDTNIRISADLTPTQRDEIKKAYEEMESRTKQGEKNLRIKYIRGVPKVVSSRSRSQAKND